MPQVRWFKVKKTVGPNGVHYEPFEEICWICGTSLTCWPLEDRASLIHRILTEALMQQEFKLVRC